MEDINVFCSFSVFDKRSTGLKVLSHEKKWSFADSTVQQGELILELGHKYP
jgi:hypothetical protein